MNKPNIHQEEPREILGRLTFSRLRDPHSHSVTFEDEQTRTAEVETALIALLDSEPFQKFKAALFLQ